MKKILLLTLAISCVPAMVHAYKIKLTNRSPVKIQMVCHLVAGPTKKTTIEPYQSGSVNTIGWLTSSIDFNVINPINGTTYKKLFHEKYGAFTRIGDKSFTVVSEPYIVTDGTVKEADLYFIDTNASHIADKIIPGFITKGTQPILLNKGI